MALPSWRRSARRCEQLNIPGFIWWDPTNLYKYGPASTRQIEQFDRDFVKDRPVKLDKW